MTGPPPPRTLAQDSWLLLVYVLAARRRGLPAEKGAHKSHAALRGFSPPLARRTLMVRAHAADPTMCMHCCLFLWHVMARDSLHCWAVRGEICCCRYGATQVDA